jgi:hypothetical protein
MFNRVRMRLAYTNRSVTALGIWAAALLLGTCALMSAPALAAEGGCSNEARRVEQSSTYLPDCRAYELVTPAHMDSGEPEAGESSDKERPLMEPVPGGHAAANGERMAWISQSPGLAGGPSPGLDYLSTRGVEGWGTEATVPPQTPENGMLCPLLMGMVAWSPDLTNGILADGDAQEGGGGDFNDQGFGCGHPQPALREADGAQIIEPAGFQNLFARATGGSSYQLVNVTPSTAPHPTRGPNEVYHDSMFLAGSTDLEHVAFEDELPLTEEAEHLTNLGEPEQKEFESACQEEPKGRACWEGHDGLYVWSEGQQPAVRLVSILPDGKAVQGSLAGAVQFGGYSRVTANLADYRHAVSGNGSRIFFQAEGKLYARENAYAGQSVAGECSEAGQQAEPGKACTIELDADQGGSGEGGGQWLGASEDGSRVFFTDENKLTAVATAQAGKPDLYEYDFAAPQGEHLTDLTADASEPADVQGVSAISEDGSYVYFVAEGKLTGRQKLPGRSPEESEPAANEDNLYLSHKGSLTFIATLTANDNCDWATDGGGCYPRPASNPGESGSTARLSGSGLYFAFNSSNQLTSYHNAGPECVQEPNAPHSQMAGSCEEIYFYEAQANKFACVSCNPNGAPSSDGATIDGAAQPTSDTELEDVYPQRNVSESGQVFFETGEALLPQDVDGVRDVYEYEHGALQLISSGTSSGASYFMDASVNGSDVFFATAEPLLKSASSEVYGIYDARVGGGLLAQNESVVAPACTSLEGCHSPLSEPPAEFTAASATLAGAGNLVVKPEEKPVKPEERPAAKSPVGCPKGQAREHGRCVRKRQKPRGKQRKPRRRRLRAKHRHTVKRTSRSGK